MKNPAVYSTPELQILNATYLLDRYPNYVEKAPVELWYAPWLISLPPPKPSLRGIASTSERIDDGGAGGSFQNQEDLETWRRVHEERVGGEYEEVTSARKSSRSQKVLYASEGYRYYGDIVIQCPPNFTPGDRCLVIGSITEYIIRDEEDGRALVATSNPFQIDDPPSSETAASRPIARERAALQHPHPVHSSPYTPPASSPSPHHSPSQPHLLEECQKSYRLALQICGASFQRPDQSYVLSKLNLVAPAHYANYLSYVRVLNSQEGDVVERCQATEQVAESMTALNVYYETLCKNHRLSCTSKCHESLRKNQEPDPLASLSRDNANVCQNDMKTYANSGLFNHQEAARMLGTAKRCQERLAKLGPCAVPSSAACQRQCQQSENSAHPACQRLQALNLSVPSTETARSGPQGPSKIPSLRPVMPPRASGERGKSTFGAQNIAGLPEPKAPNLNSFKEDSKSQSAGQRGAGYAQHGAQSSQSPQGQSEQSTPEKKPLKTQIVDGFFSLPIIRSMWPVFSDKNQKTAAANYSTSSRSLSSQGEPEFNLAKYILREEVDASGEKQCFRGRDRILCPEKDIFEAISRSYRKIAPGMVP